MSRRRQFCARQLAQLEEQLAALEDDLAAAPRSVDRLRLEREAEVLLDKIEALETALAELDANSCDRNVRDRHLEKVLQKIDFVEAKATARRIQDRFNREGGAVLLFMQRTKKQMGQFCLEEVLRVILADQIIDGQVVGAYRRYSIDMDSAISQFTPGEFLARLASYFNLAPDSGVPQLTQQLQGAICESMDRGTTLVLEIKSLDDLLETEAFLHWFLQDFWRPLMVQVADVSQRYRSKFIVALVAEGAIPQALPPEYCCPEGSLDDYRLLELPLPNWATTDIYDWLIRFRPLSPRLQSQCDRELTRLAKRIHRASEGTPQSICAELQELLA